MSVLLLLLLLLASDSSLASKANHVKSPTSSNNFVQEMLVRAHQRLTMALYKVFSRKNFGNLLLSPWSVMSLLTVTYMVSGGRTANEIGDHLRINLLRRKEILNGFEHLNEIFQNEGNSSEVLDSVSGVLVGESVHPSERLQHHLQKNLNAYIDHIITSAVNNSYDSVNSTEEAIRYTLMDKNGSLIQSLLSGHADLSSKMALWLFNVMHFQGPWQHPFNTHFTHPAKFLAKGRHPIIVDTMATKATYPTAHYPDLLMRLLELPFGHSGRYSLFILLPDEVDGLPQLEKRLQHFNLESILSEEHWVRQTKLYLPKFKFQTDVSLMEVMKKLGFRRMFSPKDANFYRLDPGKRKDRKSPYVTQMVHKASIEVNENGSKAKSTSAMKLMTRNYVAYFRVSHPFMFVLRDKIFGINLFVGRVTDPTELS